MRENLKRIRAAREMTQAGLAEALAQAGRPIPVASIAKIEAGDRRVDVDDLAALAEALETPIAQLLVDPDITAFKALTTHAQQTLDGVIEAIDRMEMAAINVAMFAQDHIDELTGGQRLAAKDWVTMGPERLIEEYKEHWLRESAAERDWQERTNSKPTLEDLESGEFWEYYRQTWEFGNVEHPEAP